MRPQPSNLLLPILLLSSTNLTTATLAPLPSRTPSPSQAPTSTSTSPLSSSLLSTLLALANTTSPESDDTFPLARRCANPCGYYGQVCCGDGQQCYTNALTQAACTYGLGATAGAASGYWSYYTTMTNTYLQTQTLSTWVTVAAVTSTTPYVPLPAVPLAATATETQTTTICNWGYSQCGTACCSSSEYCASSGTCMSTSSGLSAPLRVTSSTLLTLTTYISPTTTEAFQSAIATSNVTLTEAESNTVHLSSGAIAGIVIGAIFLLIFLFLLLLFFCFRAVWEACFGRRRGNDNKRVVTEEYRRYNDHDSRSNGRQWYAGNGGGGYGPARPQRRKEESNGLGWAGVAAGLGGLAAALGWRRRQEEKRRQQQGRGRYQKTEMSESTEYTGSSESYTSVERDERVYRNGRVVDERDYTRRTRDDRRG